MAKITSKLQVTIPKAIATVHGLKPGTELKFESAGEVIRVRPVRRGKAESEPTLRARLAAFDAASRRQIERDLRFRKAHPGLDPSDDRGWRREDLYNRGLPR